ncbi:DUF4365 domain-containing protein [Saccharothrix sp. S26]|uniref:DUF4365 domain-containing protein n=1 Tax=Saccharothrix sp. S26 TaxID=2907215 RepID=UPI001F295E17|nr:DUF4365 domain-containing protein [Saccharothrix sp. S26]MCE6998857.1 DUF4365 domain-containing protein [Saccharothrix sp. S26]
MSTVHPNRVIEDRALNRVTALLQELGHVVHRIDGRNDFGEDLYVTFVADSKITGDTIAVQVKGGASYRAASGYRVRVRQHERSWLNTNVPVACVVHDPETDELHWANASEQLRTAKIAGEEVRSVKVSSNEVLNVDTVDGFVTRMRRYIAERGEIRHALSSRSGHRLDTTDYVSYFMNTYGEELVFRQRRGESTATLLHSGYGWKPLTITPDALTWGAQFVAAGFTKASHLAEHYDRPELRQVVAELGDMDLGPLLDMIPVVGGEMIVNQPELDWLRVCVHASEWWRAAPA